MRARCRMSDYWFIKEGARVLCEIEDGKWVPATVHELRNQTIVIRADGDRYTRSVLMSKVRQMLKKLPDDRVVLEVKEDGITTSFKFNEIKDTCEISQWGEVRQHAYVIEVQIEDLEKFIEITEPYRGGSNG